MRVYSTKNFSEFIALVTLGVPPMTADGTEPGPDSAPEWREIGSDELEANGFKTIEDAEEAGFVGTVSYGYGEHPDGKAICKAFNKAHHTPKVRIDVPDVIDLRTSKGKEKAIELMATFLALAFRNRKFFNDRRTKVMARLRLKKESGCYAIIDPRSDDKTKERFSQ